MFNCPGCETRHAVWTARTDRDNWTFNGNTAAPTFGPSLLVRWEQAEPPVTSQNIEEFKRNPWPQTKVQKVCHSFVVDGRIQFLNDCTHRLAGQTVEIPQWNDHPFEDNHRGE